MRYKFFPHIKLTYYSRGLVSDHYPSLFVRNFHTWSSILRLFSVLHWLWISWRNLVEQSQLIKEKSLFLIKISVIKIFLGVFWTVSLKIALLYPLSLKIFYIFGRTLCKTAKKGIYLINVWIIMRIVLVYYTESKDMSLQRFGM